MAVMEYWIRNPDGTIKPASQSEFYQWFEECFDERVIDQTEIAEGIEVSTIFHGLNRNFELDGPPVLWKTHVFGGPLGYTECRYTSEADAKAGHERMVQRVREAIDAEHTLRGER